MKKRIALAAIAALAGGLLVAAPASATTWTFSADGGNSYVVGNTVCFTASEPGATYSWDGVSVPYGTATQNPCVVLVAGDVGTRTMGADWTSPKKSSSVTFSVSAASSSSAQGASLAGPDEWVAGPANSAEVVVTSPTDTNTYVKVSGASTSILAAPGGVISTDKLSVKLPAGSVIAITLATPVVGTVSVKLYLETAVSGIYSPTALLTHTIDVVSALSSTVYASTTVSVGLGASATAHELKDKDGGKTYFASKTLHAANSVMDISLVQKGADGKALASDNTKKVTATISGVGALSIGTLGDTGTSTAGYVYRNAASSNDTVIGVFADGRAGVGTVSISVDGVVVATKTVTFYGAVASYDVAVNSSYLNSVKNPGAAALSVSALDANGVLVPDATFYVKSAAATKVGVVTSPLVTGDVRDLTLVVPVDTFGNADVDLAAVADAAGDVVITVQDANATADVTVSKTATVHLVTGQIADLKWGFDKTSYAPGEKATITFTAKGSDGNPVADGDYVAFKSGSVNFSAGLQPIKVTALSGVGATTLSFVDGAAKLTYYMPYTSGDVLVAATLSTSTDLAAALRGAATSITAKVAAPIDAQVKALQDAVLQLSSTLTGLTATMVNQLKYVRFKIASIATTLAKLKKKLGVK